MRIAKKHLDLTVALGAMVSLCIVAGAQVVNQSGITNDPVSLRKILATQPDYAAVQTSLILNPQEGFGGKSKVAKMGNRSREETDDTIFIHEPGKPTIKIYPKSKEYSEGAVEKQNDFPISAEDIAKRDDVRFKLVGAEKVGEYNCVKIQALYKKGKGEIKYLFYVSPELKNLIIREEIFLGPVSFVTFLEDVSFDVSEELFNLTIGYKKIIEPVLNDPTKELLHELNKPGRRRARSNTKKRKAQLR
jgi:hypothetical protein